MKKIIRLTETDLSRIIRKVLNEQTRVSYSHTPENTNAEQITKKMQSLSQSGIRNWGKYKIEFGNAAPVAQRYWKLTNKSGNDYVYFDCNRKNGGREGDKSGPNGESFLQFTKEEGEKLYNIFCKVL